MSRFLERLTYLARRRESFADGLGELRRMDLRASRRPPIKTLEVPLFDHVITPF
jgi:hypothetical protein